MTALVYRVEHVSRYVYSEPASSSLMLLRLRPPDDERQRVRKFGLRVRPNAVTTDFVDSFGNHCHFFNVHRSHRSMAVESRVQVERTAAADLPPKLGAGAWKELQASANALDTWQFLQPSTYIRLGGALEQFTSANRIRRGPDPLTSLLEAAATLHRVLRYEPGRTAVDSPMEHVLETGCGVCQDYTHVFLAIGRSWGIPSRYVSGYMHSNRATEDQGASHCWGEFLLPDTGWVGIDPTNDTPADDRFIALAVGRDYADACPTKGTVVGGGASTLDVAVAVTLGQESAPDPEPRREPPNLRTLVPRPREGNYHFDQ